MVEAIQLARVKVLKQVQHLNSKVYCRVVASFGLNIKVGSQRMSVNWSSRLANGSKKDPIGYLYEF